MLRMSKLADYGTAIMTEMTREPVRVRSAAEIAAEMHLAAPTVSKVLKLLARRELVTALRGKKGGYLLSRRPGQISVVDIIDAVDGPFGLTECCSRPGLCLQEPSCAVRGHWRQVSRAVRAALEAITLTQMAEPGAHAVKAIAFHPRREGA